MALAKGAPPEGIGLPATGPIVVSIAPPPRPAVHPTSGGSSSGGGTSGGGTSGGGSSSGGTTSGGTWHHDASDSWYGPGFYGQRTACGEVLSTSLLGVAHRTLPCGTLVTFRNPNNGRTITVPVVDRGPYVSGRTWDLTYATCSAIGHCWTGPLDWHLS